MIGTTVSHYRILSELGAGGMGVIYRAEDLKLRRIVALKFLPPAVTGDPETKARFVQEARAASALDHPSVCTIHEIDETRDGQLFIVMACYEGENLRQRLARGPMPVDEAVAVATQVADGLARAHEHGIVHRDIKAANVFCDAHGQIKILDFGLAKLASEPNLTRSGMTLGTVSSMAPEQVRGEDLDARADVWAVGVLLYEMLTGRAPFAGEHQQALFYGILEKEPPSVTSLRAEVPTGLTTIVTRCLQKDPDRRFTNARELLADLRGLAPTLAVASLDAANRQPRHSVTSRSLLAIALVALVIAGIFLLRPWLFPAADARIDSLAVLPLANLSGDPAEDYFADGMTEALIAELARISSLRVISRTSAMRYKDTDLTLPRIAAELDVDAVVEGSVLRAGDRVRITAQLIRAADDRHLWGEGYARDLADVLGLQQEIARLIARAIDIELTPGESAALSEAATVDPAAHEAYLRGRHLWNRRTPEMVLQSMEYFQRSMDLDPDFALAYTGMASALVVVPNWGIRPLEPDYRRAGEMARRALELDPNQAEAIAALATVAIQLEWDWEEAGRLFQRALAVNPGSATTHQWYASYLSDLGRFEAALVEAEKARRIDPLSFIINLNLAEIHYFAGSYDDAILFCQRAREIDDRHPYSEIIEGHCRREQGRYEEAAEAYLRSLAKVVTDQTVIDTGRQAFRTGGVEGFLSWIVGDAIDLWRQPYNAPFYRATVYAWLGERDQALAELEKAFTNRCYFLRQLATEPTLASLRSEPRFEALLRRVNLAE